MRTQLTENVAQFLKQPAQHFIGGRSKSGGGTAQYDPKITYVLQGDFFESDRGERRQYYFEFKLTNLATREIVFNKHFDLAQAPAGQ